MKSKRNWSDNRVAVRGCSKLFGVLVGNCFALFRCQFLCKSKTAALMTSAHSSLLLGTRQTRLYFTLTPKHSQTREHRAASSSRSVLFDEKIHLWLLLDAFTFKPQSHWTYKSNNNAATATTTRTLAQSASCETPVKAADHTHTNSVASMLPHMLKHRQIQAK